MKLHGRIFRRVPYLGWGGERNIRLDVEDTEGGRVFVYVDKTHKLAKLRPGARLRLSIVDAAGNPCDGDA